MLKDKTLFLIVIFIVFLVIAFARFSSSEDSWICENGKWIKHGNPSSLVPTSECK